MREKKNLSVYIHIPFCQSKCIYCDFYSVIKNDKVNDFLEALHIEIENKLANMNNEEYDLYTIYFGGGSPSVLSPKQIQGIITKIKSIFKSCNKNIEITLEANPGQLDFIKLKDYHSAGVNRLSVGVQSFFDDDLKFLSRVHESKDAIKNIEDAFKAGFENINVDLIFNLPNQTKKRWIENLRKAISLPILHVSAYSLIVEKGTILNKMILDNRIKIGNRNFDADLYKAAIDFFYENNFIQYEVSNFAKEGFECKHNLTYWNYENYIGLGPSARSFIDKKRFWNYSSLNFYLNSIKEKRDAVCGSEFLSDEKIIEEFFMLGLRTGLLKIDKAKDFIENKLILEKFMSQIENKLLVLQKEKYLEYDKINKIIKLTKKGFLVCDEIILNLLKVL